MDPIRNPYAPGAGTPPPELAGRDEIRTPALIALQRAMIGRPGKSIIMVGLRGVGKTVLLDRILDDAEAIGVRALRIEAPEAPVSAVDAGAPVAFGDVGTLCRRRGR